MQGVLEMKSLFKKKSASWKRSAKSINFKNIKIVDTVKPVLNGPVLNGHPLLSGQLQKSQKFLLFMTLNVTSIKRSPLLSGRGHLLQSPSEGISIVFTCIKRSLHKRNPKERVVKLVIKSSYFF